MDKNIFVYCVDIGSYKKGKFAWAKKSIAGADAQVITGRSPAELIESLALDLAEGTVALGFECPLFVPVPADPDHFTSSRNGEGNRPWSAGAGASALATGITEVVYILGKLRRIATSSPVWMRWEEFTLGEPGLFLWEAFVTGDAKGNSDTDDASIGVEEFIRLMPEPTTGNAIDEPIVHSLIGAALLRTEWTRDLNVLSTPSLVIKP